MFVYALHSSQQSFSHIGSFSRVEAVLSNEDKEPGSRTQHGAEGGIGIHDLLGESEEFSTLLPSFGEGHRPIQMTCNRPVTGQIQNHLIIIMEDSSG